MEQYPETGRMATLARPEGYAVVVEWAETNWSAYVPDLPGCVSTGATPSEAVDNMREALALHLETLGAFGEPIPEPRTLVATIQPEGAGMTIGKW